MYLYIPIRQNLCSSECGQYRSTGIYALHLPLTESTAQTFVADISPNFWEVFCLALHCTRGQLRPYQLKEIVEDYLTI